jgi:hypothetical protein
VAGNRSDGRGETLTGLESERAGVQRSRLVGALAVTFGAVTVAFAAMGVVYNPMFLAVGALFGAVTYFMWYHASGRLAGRIYRGVEDRARRNADPGQGGFGAGPREEWTGPRSEQRRRAGQRTRAGAGPRERARANAGRAGGRRGGRATKGPSAAEAYRTLGVEPGADDETVRRAYREKVKDVHPDREGGSREQFKRVTAAYERLTESGTAK